MKLALSSKLGGNRVRQLTKEEFERDREEIWILSVLFDNVVIPLSQVTEMFTKLSKAESIEMLQVKIKGFVSPSYATSVEVDTATVGVGTE